MSTGNKILISVVVPVYNSTETLGELYEAAFAAIDQSRYFLEIIFVDDHGKKESWEKLEEIKSIHPDTVRIIRLSKNFGQNNATLCGIDHAKGEYIVTIDDDMEFHPQDIPLLLAKMEDNNDDVVYGVLKKGPNKSIRAIGRKFLYFLLNKFENGGNIGSSFRLIKRTIVEKINHHNQDHLFINQIISWYTSDIGYAEVSHHPRKHGKSGYSIKNLLGIGMRLLFYYTNFPLKMIIYFSFTTAIITFGFAMYYLIQQLTIGSEPGYSSVIVSIFAGTSIIMLGIGVLAVFVNRIYNSRIKRPNYSIKKIQ